MSNTEVTDAASTTSTSSPALRPPRRTFRFNQKIVDALPPNDASSPSREAEYTDDEVRGLKLLVSKGGRKTYYLRYTFEGRKRVYRIGEHGPFTVQTARQEANKLKAQIAMGTDPQAQRQLRKGTMSFEQFALEEYLPHTQSRNRAWKHNEYKLRGYLVPRWGKKRMDEITARDVQTMMDDLRRKYAPATANRFFAVVHRMFRLAVLWGTLEKNPANGVPKFKENNQRERYLSGDELQRYLGAMEGETCQMAMSMLRFLLLTGVRFGEAVGARWSHIDLDEAQWWLPRTKAGAGRWVLLNANALELLRSLPRIEGNDVVFRNEAGTPLVRLDTHHRRICKKAGIENLRIHDLRHTFASHAINSGATLYEVQHLLGHLCSVTTTRYAHLAESTLRKVSARVGASVTAGEAKKITAVTDETNNETGVVRDVAG